MTDKNTEAAQDQRARSKSPVLTTPANKRASPAGESEASRPAGSGAAKSILAPAALIIALVSVGFSAVLWSKYQELEASHADLVAGLASSRTSADRLGAQISEALTQARGHDGRIQALQQQADEADAIINDLDEALRIMTDRGSELVLLNDIDHLATIAQQQLQLGGNVRNAIVALESAQAQLARANRPGLASLLQTVNGDLDRLRAASTIDVGAFSNQLEELAMLLTEAPLIMPDEAGRLAGRSEDATVREQPAPTVPPAASPDEPWWERALDTTREWSRDAWDSISNDLGQFIDVRRVDDAQALLMSPDQASRFRDNLRTRVMTAQLALMMRQPEVWNTEMQAIVKAIETRYDESSPLTRKALRMARSMADASIDARLPTVDNTLHALNALREEQSRSEAPNDRGSEPSGQPGTGGVTSEQPEATSSAGQAGGAESEPSKSEAAQPEATQSETTQSEPAQSETAQSEAAQSEPAQSETPKPEAAQPEAAQSGAAQSAASQSGAPQPDAPQSGTAQSDSPQSPATAPGAAGSETDQPDTPSATPVPPAAGQAGG